MGVASCRSIFLLSDAVSNRVFVPFQSSIHNLDSIRGKRVRAEGFSPGSRPRLSRGSTQPSLTPGVNLAPSPHAPPLSHFLFPRSKFTLPLFHLSSISLALGGIPVSGCHRSSSLEVSSPSLFLSSPSSPSPAHPCSVPRARPADPDGTPARLPRARPRVAPGGGPARRVPGARSLVLVRAALARVAFKCSLNSVLNLV